MQKINIKIPDHLNKKEELIEIGKRLTQKMLASHGRQKDKKRIGNQVDIKELTTQITIERTGDKPIELILCNCCKTEYQDTEFKPVYINYGGKKKMVKVCSEKCQDMLIDICGPGRAFKKKSEYKPIRFY